MKFNCLVTGAAGFIGSHLVDELVKTDNYIYGIDNLTTGSKDNLSTNSHFIFKEFDIRDQDRLIKLFEENNIDYIFHLAADARIPSCIDDPYKSSNVNVMGTINMLELAKRFKVKGLAFSSSSAIYGNYGKNMPIREAELKRPINAYGAQKLLGDHMCRFYHQYSGVPTLALRYFNVYGSARQGIGGAYPTVFAAFSKALKEGKRLTVFGDGSQIRDYIHIDDVVKANMTILGKPKDWKPWGKAYNIGTGIETTTMDVVKLMASTKLADRVPMRPGDAQFSLASTWLAKDEMKFEAKVDLKEGVKLLKESHGL